VFVIRGLGQPAGHEDGSGTDGNGGNGQNGSEAVACTPIPCLAAVVGQAGIDCITRSDTATCLQTASRSQPCPPCYIVRGGRCVAPASNYQRCLEALSRLSQGTEGRRNGSTQGRRNGSQERGVGRMDECTKKILLTGGIALIVLLIFTRLIE
jgi:hypothetical protein